MVEFRAMVHTFYEGMWLRRVLEELRITVEGKLVVYCDYQAALQSAKNPVHYDRTKHVEIDRQ